MASPTAGFGSSGASSSSTVTSSGVSGLSIFSQHKPSTALSQFQAVVHQDPVRIGRHAFSSYTSKAYLGDQPPDFDYYMLTALSSSSIDQLVDIPFVDVFYRQLISDAIAVVDDEMELLAPIRNYSSLLADPYVYVDQEVPTPPVIPVYSPLYSSVSTPVDSHQPPVSVTDNYVTLVAPVESLTSDTPVFGTMTYHTLVSYSSVAVDDEPDITALIIDYKYLTSYTSTSIDYTSSTDLLNYVPLYASSTVYTDSHVPLPEHLISYHSLYSSVYTPLASDIPPTLTERYSVLISPVSPSIDSNSVPTTDINYMLLSSSSSTSIDVTQTSSTAKNYSSLTSSVSSSLASNPIADLLYYSMLIASPSVSIDSQRDPSLSPNYQLLSSSVDSLTSDAIRDTYIYSYSQLVSATTSLVDTNLPTPFVDQKYYSLVSASSTLVDRDISRSHTNSYSLISASVLTSIDYNEVKSLLSSYNNLISSVSTLVASSDSPNVSELDINYSLLTAPSSIIVDTEHGSNLFGYHVLVSDSSVVVAQDIDATHTLSYASIVVTNDDPEVTSNIPVPVNTPSSGYDVSHTLQVQVQDSGTSQDHTINIASVTVTNEPTVTGTIGIHFDITPYWALVNIRTGSGGIASTSIVSQSPSRTHQPLSPVNVSVTNQAYVFDYGTTINITP